MLKQGLCKFIPSLQRAERSSLICQRLRKQSIYNTPIIANKFHTTSRTLNDSESVTTESRSKPPKDKSRHKTRNKTITYSKEVVRGENLLISKTVKHAVISRERHEKQSITGTMRSMNKSYKDALASIAPMETIHGLNRALVDEQLKQNICVTANVTVARAEELISRAKSIAEQLGLEFKPNLKEAADTHPYTLFVDSDNRLKLQQLHKDDNYLPGPIYSPYPSTDLSIKAKFQYNLRSPLVRSLGKDVPLTDMRVVDATGGLGIDAFVLTFFGVHMTIIERNPIVYTLLREGYEVARQIPTLAEIMARINIIHGDSNDVLPQLVAEHKPHVIYLDPMYPLRVKTNTPGTKKEMVIARKLLGPDPKAEDMVAMALKYASSHVVLKRPYYVPPSPDAVTAYKARSTRFEIYSKHKGLSFDKAEETE